MMRMLRGQLLVVMPVRLVRRVALVPAAVVVLRRRHAVLVMALEILLILILQPQLQFIVRSCPRFRAAPVHPATPHVRRSVLSHVLD